ncbi:MAG: hypothetical protein F6K14_31845 [Symploca sp. SIO2C1]|nr:hypothetical protein [Symploca sp. SIO2C1]
MYNDRQTELEQAIPEIVQQLVSNNNNQQTSTPQAGYQYGHSQINVQDESDYIDRWYDGLIGISEE